MLTKRRISVFAFIAIAIGTISVAAHVSGDGSLWWPLKIKSVASTQRHESTPIMRNLFLRPETRRVIRSIGKRLRRKDPQISILTGSFSNGSQVRGIQVVRRQSDAGERIEVVVEGSAELLTWDSGTGVRKNGRSASDSEHELIERLVFDSPDQFVLAQLRGASYYTVARNVRPTGASDGYSGPLWDVVRVSDRDDIAGKDRAPWKLYYINVRTGFIDEIRSEVGGEVVVASLTWGKQVGESFPAKIAWTRRGQQFMEFNVSGFSVNPQ